MTTFIHARWRHLAKNQITELFHQLPPVRVLPDAALINHLYDFRSATLELLENRTTSTVYRHRQTGLVYLLRADGTRHIFDSLGAEPYTPPPDDLIEAYEHKPLVYVLISLSNCDMIRRVKPPAFTAMCKVEDELYNIEWRDEATDKAKTSAIKKAVLFLRSYR